MRFGALILLFSAFCFAGTFANVSIIKFIIVGAQTDSWATTVLELINEVAHNEDYAPQIVETSVAMAANRDAETAISVCDIIGNVDRAKLSSDFILVAKSKSGDLITCGPEMGMSNFAVWIVDGGTGATGEVAFVSDETNMDDEKWHPVQNTSALFTSIRARQKIVFRSQIPDDYPFVAEREKRVQRRIYLACISILVLFVCALLVIMFMTSLGRYNLRKAERIKAKKAEKEVPKQVEKNKEVPGKSAESSEHEKSKEKLLAAADKDKDKEKEKEKEKDTEKSEKKSEKSEKTDKSGKSEKDSEDPLRSKRSNDSLLTTDSDKKK